MAAWWTRISGQGTFVRGVAAIAAGTAGGQLLVLASAPILSRQYEPAAFGALAVFLATALILTSVGSLRYEIAIPLPREDRVAADLVVICAVLLVGGALIVAALVFVWGDDFADLMGTPNLAPFMWLLPIALLTIGLYQVFSNWALRRRALGRVARTRFNQGLGQAVVQVGIGFLRQDPFGLIAGAIVGRAGGLSTLGAWLWRVDRRLLLEVSARSARATAGVYRRFPMISTTSGLLNSLGLQAPVLIIGAYYGAVTVGWFALSQRVVALPMTYLGTAVAQSYFSEAAHRHRGEHGGLRRLYFRSAGTLALIGLVPTLIVAIGGPALFSAVFGPNWAEAGTYARILSIMFFCQFVVVPISQTLNVFEKLELQALYDVVRLVLGVGTLLLASAAGWSASDAILGYSIGMTASYLLNFALNAHTVSVSERATD